MTARKQVLQTTTSALSIVAAGKGGVGKTTLAIALADMATVGGDCLRAFQVDDQKRLEGFLPGVITIAPDFELAMRQPRALTTPFAPFYTACDAAGREGGHVLLDVGANRVDLAAMWMRKAELQEDLTTWGTQTTVFVPATAEAEALRQAASTLKLFGAALPQATLVFVENQRDGVLADLKPRSEAATVLRDELRPLLDGRLHLTMPLIENEAWAAYENHNLRFLKALAMSPARAAELLGEEVSEAKIMRSAITHFVRHMQAELAKLQLVAKGTV